jgi:hypothetical protein
LRRTACLRNPIVVLWQTNQINLRLKLRQQGNALTGQKPRSPSAALKKRAKFKGFGEFKFVPVWFPDSKQLLVNEIWDGEKFTFAVKIVDVATGKMKLLFKGKPPVLAWAEAR